MKCNSAEWYAAHDRLATAPMARHCNFSLIDPSANILCAQFSPRNFYSPGLFKTWNLFMIFFLQISFRVSLLSNSSFVRYRLLVVGPYIFWLLNFASLVDIYFYIFFIINIGEFSVFKFYVFTSYFLCYNNTCQNLFNSKFDFLQHKRFIIRYANHLLHTFASCTQLSTVTYSLFYESIYFTSILMQRVQYNQQLKIHYKPVFVSLPL